MQLISPHSHILQKDYADYSVDIAVLLAGPAGQGGRLQLVLIFYCSYSCPSS